MEPTLPRTPAAPPAAPGGHPDFPNSAGRRRPKDLLAGGTVGNELLTTVTGAALIVLLAIVGVTILRIGPLLSVHMFVGVILLGPIALKLASTGYRFTRYYTHNLRYRAGGPPATPMRLIAPVVVLTTVVVMASGVALLLGGPQSRGTFFTIHKLSFFLWVAFTALHVVGHLPDLWSGLQQDYGASARLRGAPPGRSGRALALASALILGLVLAVIALSLPQFGSWLNAPLHHH